MSKLFDIYNHPRIYDDQYWWKKDDIEFYKNKIYPGLTALELGSGTGRLSRPLYLNNVKYYGLEISKKFHDYAKKKNSINNDINFINADMVNFNLNMKFDRILIAFNSFNHLIDEKDGILCLKNIKKHLNKDGMLIMDIINPHPMFLCRNEDERILIMDFKDSKNGELVEIYEKCKYNHEKEICNVEWEYVYNRTKSLNKNLIFKMKMYYPDTFNRMLIDSGFKIDIFCGDFSMSSFNEESPSQIYICK